MEAGRLLSIAERLVIANATGKSDCGTSSRVVDTERYTSLDRHRAEVERIFHREAQLVGLSGDIAALGAYITVDLGDLPVIVARGDDGVARAFLNSCRHRGTELVCDRGVTTRFVCPYHHWTYAQDGRLVAVPSRESFADASLAERNLIELPLAEKYGLLVVSPDPTRMVDVDAFLGHPAPEIASLSLATAQPVMQRNATVACNWKMTNEMGLDGYHVRYLHSESLHGQALWECVYDQFGRHHRLGFANVSLLDAAPLPTADTDLLGLISLTTYLYPSTFVVVGTHAVVYQRSVPGKVPGECSFHLATYSWQPLDDEALVGAHEFFEFLWKLSINEDIRAQEGSQRAFASGLVDHTVFGANEPALARLHESWDAALAD